MIFPEIDTELIRNVLLKVSDQFRYFVDSYSLINLVLHIATAIDRIQNQSISMVDIEHMSALSAHEYELTRGIASRIEESF